MSHRYTREEARAAGHLGGVEIRERLGHTGMVRMGSAGGAATRERHGAAHFSALGKAGARARQAKARREVLAEVEERIAACSSLEQALALVRQLLSEV